MSLISGDELQSVVDNAVKWYTKTRLDLIEAFEESTPYGQQKLTEIEQVMNFDQLQAQDWTQMLAQLYDRYRGLPDMEDRVNKDLAGYVARMFGLRSKLEPDT